MGDDRDDWRRQDERREELRREYRREEYRREEYRRDDLRDEYRREDNLRDDWEDEDRRYDERRRDDDHRRAMEEIRRGNTASALNSIAGPDAAIDYLRAIERIGWHGPGRGDAVEQRWPHTFVTSIDELLANVAATPWDVQLRAARIDGDGDAVVEAIRMFQLSFVTEWSEMSSARPVIGRFYVRAALLADVEAVARSLRRGAELAAGIVNLTTDR